MKRLFIVATAAAILCGCTAPATNYVQADTEKLTLGKAQMTLKKGMSQSEVVAELGSPNMVTRDRSGIETWVYDKSSTEAISTGSRASGTILILSARSSQSASQSTQRTLTLILKFQDGVLSDFSYRSTSF